MTEAVEQQQEQHTQEQPEVITLEQFKALSDELERYKAKHGETEKHRKEAERRAKELEEAQAAEAEARAKEKGEFKELYEREQKAKAELAEKYESFAKRIQQKEVETVALSIASELTRDTKRAELLREQISKFTRYTDDGVKFEMGGVEVDRAKIMAHISDNYPFLIDGSGATGGGATGGNRGGSAATIGKPDGDKHERAAYFAKKFGIQS